MRRGTKTPASAPIGRPRGRPKKQPTLDSFVQTPTYGSFRVTRSRANENVLETMMEDGDGPSTKRTKHEDASSLAKKMLENNAALKLFSSSLQNSSSIPDSLAELDSDEEESINPALEKLGKAVDNMMDSEQIQKLKAEHEIRIVFDCPRFNKVGTFGKVFCLKNLQQIRALIAKEKVPGIDAFQILFLTSPNTKMRCDLLRRIEAKQGGYKVHFNSFMFALSHCFQIANNDLCPDGIRIDGFEQIIQGMDQFRIAGTREAETVQRENIHLLLDIFSCLCFDDWQDSQLLCMLTALSRLYLDQQNVNIRHRITKAIRMLLAKLAETSQERVDGILQKFASKHLLQAAENEMGRAIELFTMFIRLERFSKFKLHAAQAMLLSQQQEEVPPVEQPTLGDVLFPLPDVIRRLKAENRVTDIYLLYNRLIDHLLNIDDEILLAQENQSLVDSIESYQEALGLLTKKNMNDKMIDMWARSLHRMRDVQQMRKNKLELDRSRNVTVRRNAARQRDPLDSSDSEDEIKENEADMKEEDDEN